MCNIVSCKVLSSWSHIHWQLFEFLFCLLNSSRKLENPTPWIPGYYFYCCIHTLTSALLKAWKVLAVSGLAFGSAFFTSVSFTTGVDDADTGDGFCGGFCAWRRQNGTDILDISPSEGKVNVVTKCTVLTIRFICLVQRAQYHTSRGSFTSLSVTWGLWQSWW